MVFFSFSGQYPNSPKVTKQAESANTIGSANPTDTIGIINPNQSPSFSYSPSNLSSDTPTKLSLLNDPNFGCSLVLLANSLSCSGELPFSGCEYPKEILASKINQFSADTIQPWGFEIECGCVDNNKDDLYDEVTDDDIGGIANPSAAQECLDKAASQVFNRCITQMDVNGLLDILPFVEGGDPTYSPIISSVADKVKEILNNDAEYSGRANDAIWQLDQLNTALFIGGVVIWNDRISTIIDLINGCKDDVDNQCELHRIPSLGAIKTALSLISRKPELVCENGNILDPSGCECVCPSGTYLCEADDSCVECKDGKVFTPWEPSAGAFGRNNCKCECPAGTVQYNIPTNMGPRPSGMQMTPCIPECPEGYIFKEIPMGPGGPSDCTYAIDDRCYDCVCRKGPSNYWQNPTLVPEEACADDARPDPDNECKCKCNNEKHIYYYGDDMVGVNELPAGCYCGVELELQTEELRIAYCNNIQLPSNPNNLIEYYLMDEIIRKTWNHDLCECICASGTQLVEPSGNCECINPLHLPSYRFGGCVCGDLIQMADAWDEAQHCNTAATGKIWNMDICECACPSGTNWDQNIEECVCATGATVTSPGAPSSAADCECPAGQIITGNRESGYYCASGAYSYTSNIPSNLIDALGYTHNYTLELL